MGLYSQMVIQTTHKLDSSELLKIRNNIIERFGDSLFRHTGEDLVHQMDEDGYRESNLDKYVYEIDMDCRLYSEFYQRGDGLKISALIIYLTREDNDYLFSKYTELDAIRLYNYFIKYGSEIAPPEVRTGDAEQMVLDVINYIYGRCDGNMLLPCLTAPRYRINVEEDLIIPIDKTSF